MEQEQQNTAIRRKADFLDVGIEVVQEGANCHCRETKVSERPWAVLSDDLDVPPPDGWFFLKDVFYNRITIRDLMANKMLEISPELFTMPSGRKVKVARIIPE
jgi:hypothetical protein